MDILKLIEQEQEKVQKAAQQIIAEREAAEQPAHDAAIESVKCQMLKTDPDALELVEKLNGVWKYGSSEGYVVVTIEGIEIGIEAERNRWLISDDGYDNGEIAEPGNLRVQFLLFAGRLIKHNKEYAQRKETETGPYIQISARWNETAHDLNHWAAKGYSVFHTHAYLSEEHDLYYHFILKKDGE